MLVQEVIFKIQNKELTIKQLAEIHKVSDRTVQSKIKKLGYSWDSKAASYKYTGETPEPKEVNFNSLFNNGKAMASKGESKSTSEIKLESEIKSNNKVSTKISKESNSERDIIDILLEGKAAPSKRVYRGFYFDSDVLSIIDSVPKNSKSELVNEALRKVFKDKGFL